MNLYVSGTLPELIIHSVILVLIYREIHLCKFPVPLSTYDKYQYGITEDISTRFVLCRVLLCLIAAYYTKIFQGLYSSEWASYRKISWSPKAARLGVIIILSRSIAGAEVKLPAQRLEKSNPESCGFETSLNIAVRRPSAQGHFTGTWAATLNIVGKCHSVSDMIWIFCQKWCIFFWFKCVMNVSK